MVLAHLTEDKTKEPSTLKCVQGYTAMAWQSKDSYSRSPAQEFIKQLTTPKKVIKITKPMIECGVRGWGVSQLIWETLLPRFSGPNLYNTESSTG